MPPKRKSSKEANILDSLSRYLSSTSKSFDYVIAAAYHKGYFLVTGNTDQQSREKALPDLQRLTEELRIFFSRSSFDIHNYLLGKVRLKDLKADRLENEFNIAIAKHKYELTSSEDSLFQNYLKETAKINAYQLLSKCAKHTDKRKNKSGTTDWVQKNCNLEEIGSRFDKNLSLDEYTNLLADGKLEKLLQDQPIACNFIKTWFEQGYVPKAEISTYIDIWREVAPIIRNLALQIQESENSGERLIKLLNDFSRSVIDVERIITLYKSDSEEAQSLSEGKFEFVHGKDDSHAEMIILDRIFKDLHIGDKVYIGVSKLCCGCCYSIIKDFDKVIPKVEIHVNGTHYKPYPDGWTPPDFLRLYPDIAFQLIQSSFGVAHEFIKSLEQEATGTYETADLSDYEPDSIGEAHNYLI